MKNLFFLLITFSVNVYSQTASSNYDLIYHRCEWRIDPQVNYIEGCITSYFKPTVFNFQQLQFNLSKALTIDSIKYHNSLLSFTHTDNDILQLNFTNSLAIHTLDSVSVYYKGIPVSTEMGSFVQSTHNGAPIIWTLSEPYGAKDWWPCKQDLSDKIDSVDIIVTTPQINRVASNGLLLSEITSGNNKIYHWKTNYPIASYLIGVSVTNYVFYSGYVPLSATDTLEVLNYVYPEYLDTAKALSPEIIKIISFYDSLIIPYPFAKEKYGHAQFGFKGGQEHQTMSFVLNFDHALLAHECAHQWFGDYITCGSWQDIWLNEGFATYFEGLIEERFYPETFKSWKQTKISNITSLPDGSVFCDDTTETKRIFNSRLSYNKGAYLLHMLRWKLGDTTFFDALKSYLKDSLLAGKFARTNDLKRHMENVSGQDLTSFFDQWYYNQGYPSYQVNYTQTGSEVGVTINQTQSHSSVLFYELPVPVKFVGENTDTTIVFNHNYSGQNFSVTLNFQVKNIEFDPKQWLLSVNNTVSNYDLFEPIVYPNPTSENISLTVLLNNKQNLLMELADTNGNMVLKQTISFPLGISTQIISIADVYSGIYILRVSGDHVNYVHKIIKK
jgi:aminopeptidase N